MPEDFRAYNRGSTVDFRLILVGTAKLDIKYHTSKPRPNFFYSFFSRNFSSALFGATIILLLSDIPHTENPSEAGTPRNCNS